MTSLCKRIVLLAVAFGLCAPPALAVPVPQVTGGFGISPARRDVIGAPPTSLTSTNVVNGTSSSYRVTVFPAILTQELSGAFEFADTPLNLNNSRIALSTSPDSFVLPPGGSQHVDLRWNMLPSNQKWIAMGVVFQGVAEGQSGPVHVITRLLSVNFLSLPGLNKISGEFTGLYAEQFGRKQLRFVARVENTGNRVSAPSAGRLTIQNSSGNVLLSERWAGDVILPGAQRDFPIDVSKVLPAGPYTATVTMHFGGEQSRSTAFTLVGPNQLPTPAIAIRDFNATGVVGSPAKVTARIISDGTAPAGVTLHIYLARASSIGQGAQALATGQVTYADLAPGSVRHLSHPLGRALRHGTYRVVATWTDHTGAQHTLEAQFTTTAARSLFATIWSFVEPVLIGLLVLALLLLLAELVRRAVRRQRRVEAELATVRAQLAAAESGEHPAPQRRRAGRATGLGTDLERTPPRPAASASGPRPPAGSIAVNRAPAEPAPPWAAPVTPTRAVPMPPRPTRAEPGPATPIHAWLAGAAPLAASSTPAQPLRPSYAPADPASATPTPAEPAPVTPTQGPPTRARPSPSGARAWDLPASGTPSINAEPPEPASGARAAGSWASRADELILRADELLARASPSETLRWVAKPARRLLKDRRS